MPCSWEYWANTANVEAELRAFMATHSITGRLPRQAEAGHPAHLKLTSSFRPSQP